jgi:hypothetical protein
MVKRRGDSAKTLLQSPAVGCRKSRALGYQGMGSPSRPHRWSQFAGRHTQSGTPSAPAKLVGPQSNRDDQSPPVTRCQASFTASFTFSQALPPAGLPVNLSQPVRRSDSTSFQLRPRNLRDDPVGCWPLETPTTGSYFVIVRASAANAETTVACGNLAPPTQ